jgi:hypothetical protein
MNIKERGIQFHARCVMSVYILVVSVHIAMFVIIAKNYLVALAVVESMLLNLITVSLIIVIGAVNGNAIKRCLMPVLVNGVQDFINVIFPPLDSMDMLHG